jgi:hypothetical protein
LLAPAELVMDAKSKERDCIYFDRLTGEGIATVNRGQWYNMMLFMHIMQKNRAVSAASDSQPQKLDGLANPFG